MVAASRSKKKQVQPKRDAVTNEKEEAMPEATNPLTEQEQVKEDPSTSKPVRIYADGGLILGARPVPPLKVSWRRQHKACKEQQDICLSCLFVFRQCVENRDLAITACSTVQGSSTCSTLVMRRRWSKQRSCKYTYSTHIMPQEELPFVPFVAAKLDDSIEVIAEKDRKPPL